MTFNIARLLRYGYRTSSLSTANDCSWPATAGAASPIANARGNVSLGRLWQTPFDPLQPLVTSGVKRQLSEWSSHLIRKDRRSKAAVELSAKFATVGLRAPRRICSITSGPDGSKRVVPKNWLRKKLEHNPECINAHHRESSRFSWQNRRISVALCPLINSAKQCEP